MSTITTHVLDTSLGCPAAGVPVRLEHVANGHPTPVAEGVTDASVHVTSAVCLSPEAATCGALCTPDAVVIARLVASSNTPACDTRAA